MVEARLGYRSLAGEVLCGPCYFGAWEPRGNAKLSTLSERLRPDPRRPPKGKTVWIPGPTAELDPRHRHRLLDRFRRHH